VSLLTPVRFLGVCLSVGLLTFLVTTLGILILYPYAPDPGFSAVLSGSYLLGTPLSVVSLFGVLYGWILSTARLVIVRFSRRIHSISPSARLLSGIGSVKQASEPPVPVEILRVLLRPAFLLGISFAASIFLAWFPYRPDLNPTGTLVGTDTGTYVDWTVRMLSLAPAQAVTYSFVGGLNGSRPLLLLILYLACLGGSSPSFTIQILPLFLAPSLSMALYVFVYFGKGDARLAGLTALFTPFSYYVTTGMWGGYYANWFGLIIGFLFLACLLRQSRSPTRVTYFAMVLLSTALFLTHPWTWLLIASASAAFEFSLCFDTRRTPHAVSLVGIVLPGVLLDYAKTLVFSTPGVVQDLTTKISFGGSVAGFWNTSVDGLLYTHSGLLANWLLMGLALVSGFTRGVKGSFERLLMFWVAAGSVSFLFLDSYNKARVVFDLPIPVLAAMGTVVVLQRVGSWNVLLVRLFFVGMLTLAAAYALQGMLLL